MDLNFMSYLRGKYYFWKGSDGVHLWAFDGEDGWKDSVWAEAFKNSKRVRKQKPAGVCLPEPILDEFVVMRFAELIDERKLIATCRRALKKWRGNGGAISLSSHAKQIVAQMSSVKPDRGGLSRAKLKSR